MPKSLINKGFSDFSVSILCPLKTIQAHDRVCKNILLSVNDIHYTFTTNAPSMPAFDRSLILAVAFAFFSKLPQ